MFERRGRKTPSFFVFGLGLLVALVLSLFVASFVALVIIERTFERAVALFQHYAPLSRLFAFGACVGDVC